MATLGGVLSLLSLFFLTASSSSAAASYDESSSTTGIKHFSQCFLNNNNNKADNLPPLLFYPSNVSYQSVLRSSAQNFRFLFSETNHKPVIIVNVTLESHVSKSVVCAREHGLGVRVRSGGHDYEGMSYVAAVDDGPFVLVDLASLRSVEVDVARGTAWVQAGATLGELYYWVSTASKGKFGFPAGTCTTVGVGGLISGGGQGRMVRKFGLASDNVIDARVVGIDGRILDRTKMGEDLFWAIRGGGGASFGIILAYKLSLVRVPPLVTSFTLYRNLNQNASQLVTRWQAVAPNLDKNLFIRVIALVTTAIDDDRDDGAGEEAKSSLIVMFNSLFLGNRSELLSVMEKSFPELGLRSEDASETSWIVSTLGDVPKGSTGIGGLLDRTQRFVNSSFKAKSDYVKKPIAREDWDKILKFISLRGGGGGGGGKENNNNNTSIHEVVILLEPYGGRMSEIPASATPFPHRKGNLYNVQYFTRWNGTDAAVAQRHLDWMRELYAFMTPYVSTDPRAAYYNYKDIDLNFDLDLDLNLDSSSSSSSTTTIDDDDQIQEEEESRRRKSMDLYTKAQVWGNKYFLDNFKRLASVKARVDPDNFFTNEQSIPPLL